MNTITEKTIDIGRVLTDKMGSKAKYVPAFVRRYLERLVHQDDINDFLWRHRDLTGSKWLWQCTHHLDMKLEVVGREHLPTKDDPRLYTFVSNHPLGGIDGISIGAVLGSHYDDRFRYLVNDLLMNLPGLAPLCIPINKTGAQSRNFPAMVEAGFSSNNHIVMFPAGICSRRQKDGTIHDIPWKKTFITKSVQYHRDVVPMRFDGQNSEFFYRLSSFSDRYIKKVNIAMIYLPDEMYKNAHKTFRLTIGEPIPWQTFDKSKTPSQWAQYVQDKVYQL